MWVLVICLCLWDGEGERERERERESGGRSRREKCTHKIIQSEMLKSIAPPMLNKSFDDCTYPWQVAVGFCANFEVRSNVGRHGRGHFDLTHFLRIITHQDKLNFY